MRVAATVPVFPSIIVHIPALRILGWYIHPYSSYSCVRVFRTYSFASWRKQYPRGQSRWELRSYPFGTFSTRAFVFKTLGIDVGYVWQQLIGLQGVILFGAFTSQREKKYRKISDF